MFALYSTVVGYVLGRHTQERQSTASASTYSVVYGSQVQRPYRIVLRVSLRPKVTRVQYSTTAFFLCTTVDLISSPRCGIITIRLRASTSNRNAHLWFRASVLRWSHTGNYPTVGLKSRLKCGCARRKNVKWRGYFAASAQS